MLDARTVAFIGIGHAPPLVSRLGLWDAEVSVSPDFIPGGRVQPGKKTRLRHAAIADGRLFLGCTVSASASLRIAAAAAVDVGAAIDSTASLRIGAAAEMTAGAAIEATADVRDVVLEMLLLVD